MSAAMELDDRSPSPEFELVMDATADEEDSLGFSMLSESGEKLNADMRHEEMRGIEVVDTDASRKPNQPGADEDIKAHLPGDDEIGHDSESPAVDGSLKRGTTDPEGSLPCSGHQSRDRDVSFWHITDKTELFNILRKHPVLILNEIPPELMVEIRQVADVYVLHSSEEARLENPDEWHNVFGAFLSLLDQPMPDQLDQPMPGQRKFVFVDPSFDPQSRGPDIITDCNTLLHYRFGELVHEDSQDVTKAGVATAISLIDPQPCEKAEKRGSVLLPCLAADKTECCATGEIKRWECDKCHQQVQYGFDGRFYCDCGKAPADSFVFHCGKHEHGPEHVGFEDLETALLHIKPFKETDVIAIDPTAFANKVDKMDHDGQDLLANGSHTVYRFRKPKMNILLLGKSGVGKSTFINAFANQTKYNKLEEVEMVECLIPTSFLIQDPQTFDDIEVTFGEKDTNENTGSVGANTKEPKEHHLYFNDTEVCVIDTPGIADAGGVESDTRNMKNVVKYLSKFKEIDAVCILLKANDNKLDTLFKYCVLELFARLNKGAAPNIFFLFTHSRATFYTPGETSRVLKELLKEIKESNNVDIPFSRANTFCFDTEAFRFLVARRPPNNVIFTPKQEKDFGESWEINAGSFRGLLQTIDKLSPHVVADTLAVNHARHSIDALRQPLAEVMGIIDKNIELSGKRLLEVKSSENTMEALRNLLYEDRLDLSLTQLEEPRTVCTHPSCCEVLKVGSQEKTHYKVICHDPCFLETDECEDRLVGDLRLKDCQAFNQYEHVGPEQDYPMDRMSFYPDSISLGDTRSVIRGAPAVRTQTETCNVCTHSLHVHMHTYYETATTMERIENTQNVTDFKKAKDFKDAQQQEIKNIQERIQEWQEEKIVIHQSLFTFARFLEQHAVTAFNDAYEEYLEIQIKTKRQGLHESDKTEAQRLEIMLKDYREQRKIYVEYLSKGPSGGNVTSDEIRRAVAAMCSLPKSGPQIHKGMKMITDAKENEQQRVEELRKQLARPGPKREDKKGSWKFWQDLF